MLRTIARRRCVGAPRLGCRGVLQKATLEMDWSDTKIETINAQSRVGEGTKYCKWLRKQHRVPALIFGKDAADKHLIHIERSEIDKLHRKKWFYNQVYDIDVEGTVYRVIPKVCNVHPVLAAPLHLTFFKWEPNQSFDVKMPLIFDNEEDNECNRTGGLAYHVMLKLKCRWSGDHRIPKFIYVDCNMFGGKSGDTIKVKDLVIPPELVPLVDMRHPVLKLEGPSLAAIPAPETKQEIAKAKAGKK